MTETTTIQITKEQARELEARKSYDDEPYKSVIARLLESDSDMDLSKVVELLERVPEKTANELEGRFR